MRRPMAWIFVWIIIAALNGSVIAESQHQTSECGQSNWQFFVVNTFTHPIGDGWVVLIAELALKNVGSHWNQISSLGSRSPQPTTLHTEEGFTYDLYSGRAIELPADVSSSYAGRTVQHSSELSTYVVPPGFIVRGSSDSKLHLIFQIAETVTPTSVSLSTMITRCFLENGFEQNQFIPAPIALQTTESLDYPYDPTLFTPLDHTQSFDMFVRPVGGKAFGPGAYVTALLENVVKEENSIRTIFQVENPSAGYGVEGGIYGSWSGVWSTYIVDSQGIYYRADNSFNSGVGLGPNQEGTAELRFGMPSSSVENMPMFLVIAHPDFDDFVVLDLPQEFTELERPLGAGDEVQVLVEPCLEIWSGYNPNSVNLVVDCVPAQNVLSLKTSADNMGNGDWYAAQSGNVFGWIPAEIDGEPTIARIDSR